MSSCIPMEQFADVIRPILRGAGESAGLSDAQTADVVAAACRAMWRAFQKAPASRNMVQLVESLRVVVLFMLVMVRMAHLKQPRAATVVNQTPKRKRGRPRKVQNVAPPTPKKIVPPIATLTIEDMPVSDEKNARE